MRFLVFIFLFISFSFGQLFDGKRNRIASPQFKLNHREVYNDSLKKTITEIQVQVNYDHLVFNREENGEYTSNYDITLKLTDSENNFIENSFKHEKITTKKFNETNLNSKKNITRFHFFLENKSYIAQVLLEDKHSKKGFVNKIQFTPTLQAEDFSINNLKFYEIDPKTKMKKLNEGRVFGNRQGKLLIRFQANYSDHIDSIFYRIYITSTLTNKRVYFNTLNIATKKENSEIELFFEKSFFKGSSYRFTLEAISDSKNSIKKEAFFSFVWYKSPNTLEEMEIALNQMSYIANRDSIDHLVELKDLERSKKFFTSTWKKMTDSNTDTEVLNLMDEYFKRVNYANKNFGKYLGKNRGWKTDRGRILIKFGLPDEIQRFPFQSNSRAYIVWNYNHERKYFVFVETLHNEYRLSENTRHYEYQ